MNTTISRLSLLKIVEPIARGMAAFLGGFTLLNLGGSVVAREFDCNVWWIDLRPLPVWAADAFLLGGALALLIAALRPPTKLFGRALVGGVIGMLAVVTICNAVGYYGLLHRGKLHAGIPVPLSALLALLLAEIAIRVKRRSDHRPRLMRSQWLLLTGTIAACVIALPLAQMLFFGGTDYRRRADAAVVFGARTYADGRPSLALADRVNTACDLYHAGLVPKLIFSGGPGDGDIDEPHAMRQLALNRGVPESAILLDEQGLNTDATVRDTLPLFRENGIHRVLAVSHGYHLPRVKMAYRRAGWEVYTVPAQETRTLGSMPFLVAREVAAVWVYYLRPL